MNFPISAVVFGVSIIAGVASRADTEWRADDYINCTAFSQRIVLIDVKDIKIRTTKTDGGLESREVTVVSKRVETLRGKDSGSEFIHTSEEIRITDRAEAELTQPAGVVDILRRDFPHRPSSCQVGHRYLVIFLSDMTFFIEVPKDIEKWRERVLEFREPR